MVTFPLVGCWRGHHSGHMAEAGDEHPAGPGAARILVVDDDRRLRALLERYLREQGYDVRGAEDGTDMRRALGREHIDLIVLDLMLPGEDGLSICSRLRAEGDDTPVLMLTARGDDVDRIVGLEIGADDYLPKPCNPRELSARIKAILRRRPKGPPGAPDPGGGIVRFGAFELDLGSRALTCDRRPVDLTSGEFAMLAALVRHPHQPLSRDRLLTISRGREHTPFDRSVDVQVSRLRKLIEHDPARPRYIQTLRGVGYVFVPDGIGGG